MLPSRLALRGGSTDIAQKRTFEEFNSSHSETAGRKKRVEGPQRGMKEFDLDVPLRKSRGGNGSEFSLDSQASIPTELVDDMYSFIEENSIPSDQLQSSETMLRKLEEGSIKVDNQYRLQHGVNASLNISDDSEGVWTNVALVNNTSKKAAVSDEEESFEDGMQRFDFELFDPVKEDRDSISSLLQGYLGPLHFDSWQMACDIVRQADHVGSVLKVGGGGEALGFVSMLKIDDFMERDWCRKFLAFVRSQCPRPLRPQVYELIGDMGNARPKKRVGIVFCERVMNLPISLSLPMFKTLFEEIRDAQANKTQEEERTNETAAEEDTDQEFDGNAIVTKDWNVDYYMILVRKLLWDPKTRERRNTKRKFEGFSGHDSLMSVSAEEIKSLAGSADLSVDGSSLLGTNRIRNLTVNGINAGEEYLLEDSKLFRDLSDICFSVSFRRVGQVMEGVSRRNEICFIPAGKEEALVERLRQEVGEEALASARGYSAREEEL